MPRLALLLLCLLLPVPVLAETLVEPPEAPTPTSPSVTILPLRPSLYARESALVRPKGSWSVGVFNPVRWAFADRMEVEIHPLVALLAPHATVRYAHVQSGDWAVTGEYGLGLATPALRVGPPGLGGYLAPSCKVADHDANKAQWCQETPWVLVPSAGVVVSHGPDHEWTARADLARGGVLSGERHRPMDAWPYLDLLMAPTLSGWRARVGLGWDRPIGSRWRARAQADLFRVTEVEGEDRSPWTARLYAGFDLHVAQSSRFTLGAMYWNSDQHRVLVEKGEGGFGVTQRVRSHDVMPTIDFIWSN